MDALFLEAVDKVIAPKKLSSAPEASEICVAFLPPPPLWYCAVSMLHLFSWRYTYSIFAKHESAILHIPQMEKRVREPEHVLLLKMKRHLSCVITDLQQFVQWTEPADWFRTPSMQWYLNVPVLALARVGRAVPCHMHSWFGNKLCSVLCCEV